MKKTAMLFAAAAFIISCTKPKDDIAPPSTTGPTFSLSTSFGNKTYTAPQTTVKIFEGKFSVGTGKQFMVTHTIMTFTTTGGAISNYRNLRYSLVKKDGSFAIAPSLLSGPLPSSANSPVDVRLDMDEIATAILSVDVATPGFTGKITAKVTIQYEYYDGEGQRKTGSLSVDGQEITFADQALVTAVHTSTPKEGLVLAGQSDTTLSLAVTAQGGDMTITSIPIICNNQLSVERFDVYMGTALITSVPVSSTDTLRAAIDATIQEGATGVFTFRAVPKAIASNTPTGFSIKTTVANIRYKNADGDLKIAAAARTGNDQFVVKAIAAITFASLGNTTIVDSTSRPVLHFFVSGSISWKSIAAAIRFGDQGTDNQLAFGNFKLFEGPQSAMVDRTSAVKFFDVNGQIDTVYTESDTKFYMAWVGGTNEDVVSGTKEYWIYMKPTGFTGSGDEVIIETTPDDLGTEYNRLSAIPGTQLPGLSNAVVVQKANFNWSDRSAGGAHSANIVIGSSDWLSSKYIKSMASTTVLHQ